LVRHTSGGSGSSGGRHGGTAAAVGGSGSGAAAENGMGDDWSFARLPLLTNFFGCVAKPPQPLPGEVRCSGVTAHVRVAEHFLEPGLQVRGGHGVLGWGVVRVSG
jgi:hypothetical protein